MCNGSTARRVSEGICAGDSGLESAVIPLLAGEEGYLAAGDASNPHRRRWWVWVCDGSAQRQHCVCMCVAFVDARTR
jgi:hypothetical protein